jgi:RHS repeat-associated protein
MRTTKEYDFRDRLTAISSSNPQLLSSFLWGLDLSGSPQGAGGVGGLLAVSDQSTINSQPSTHFVSYDGNGNVAALVSAADGTVSANYEYGPFGELIRASGPMAKANPLRFSTKWQDDETDLLYYGYRYYNAGTGRWISRDPIEEEGGLNIYTLSGNDTVGRADFLGLSCVLERISGGHYGANSGMSGEISWGGVFSGGSLDVWGVSGPSNVAASGYASSWWSIPFTPFGGHHHAGPVTVEVEFSCTADCKIVANTQSKSERAQDGNTSASASVTFSGGDGTSSTVSVTFSSSGASGSHSYSGSASATYRCACRKQ